MTLEELLPGVSLEAQAIPLCPELKLQLIEPNYPQQDLPRHLWPALMERPPFWVFCWPSGHLIAGLFREHPVFVAGRRVLDVGCGCAVVALAAAQAGASQVGACDLEEEARLAAQRNAHLNQMTLSVARDYRELEQDYDLVVLADVLYDEGNVPLVAELAEAFPTVLLADSRYHEPLAGFEALGQGLARAVPDLDLHDEFGCVSLYASGLSEPHSRLIRRFLARGTSPSSV